MYPLVSVFLVPQAGLGNSQHSSMGLLGLGQVTDSSFLILSLWNYLIPWLIIFKLESEKLVGCILFNSNRISKLTSYCHCNKVKECTGNISNAPLWKRPSFAGLPNQLMPNNFYDLAAISLDLTGGLVPKNDQLNANYKKRHFEGFVHKNVFVTIRRLTFRRPRFRRLTIHWPMFHRKVKQYCRGFVTFRRPTFGIKA